MKTYVVEHPGFHAHSQPVGDPDDPDADLPGPDATLRAVEPRPPDFSVTGVSGGNHQLGRSLIRGRLRHDLPIWLTERHRTAESDRGPEARGSTYQVPAMKRLLNLRSGVNTVCIMAAGWPSGEEHLRWLTT